MGCGGLNGHFSSVGSSCKNSYFIFSGVKILIFFQGNERDRFRVWEIRDKSLLDRHHCIHLRFTGKYLLFIYFILFLFFIIRPPPELLPLLGLLEWWRDAYTWHSPAM